mmetsp:Transcript_13170/g.18235  ORF Transcript_13170/g.18235 Transcript_13170/m.18235 type:complete len:470 (+) Transcript_13170:57-1466(+)
MEALLARFLLLLLFARSFTEQILGLDNERETEIIRRPYLQRLLHSAGGLRKEGRKIRRAGEVFARSAAIYCSYKANLALVPLRCRGDSTKHRQMIDKLHNTNSERMLRLCLDLRGFYVKAGQFLSTRRDFMPEIYCKKLGMLCDEVPPMSQTEIENLLQKELNTSWKSIFETINMTSPLGSASIAQVHTAILKSNKQPVALKLQNPRAEELMQLDLECLKAIAGFLQKTGDIRFDLRNAVIELKRQIADELDFRKEANAMSEASSKYLNKPGSGNIRIPQPIAGLVTRRLVTMTLLDGVPLTSFDKNEGSKLDSILAQGATATAADLLQALPKNHDPRMEYVGREIVDRMTKFWGMMVMQGGFFHADPHPGNILLVEKKHTGWWRWLNWVPCLPPPGFDLGVIDWGQVKRIDDDMRERLAKLLISIRNSDGQHPEIATHFLNLGIKVLNGANYHSVKYLRGTRRVGERP